MEDEDKFDTGISSRADNGVPQLNVARMFPKCPSHV